jgi:hypothetical protein
MFACASDSTCLRNGCKTSSACGGGYCVSGVCWAVPGQCNLPVP